MAPSEPTIAEVPSDSRPSPPTLRPSATTVYPKARRIRVGALFANVFWSALAVAFGASSAAVWWELTVEPEQASAPRPITALPKTTSWPQSATPTSSAPSPGDVSSAAPPLVDRGSVAHEGNDATATSAPSDVTACVRRYFAPDSFAPEQRLDYVCAATDLRNVKERVHRDVVRHAGGARTPALVSWGTLGWYQLPLLATVRHGCCADEGRTTQLPRQHGPCDGLGEAIDAVAASALLCGGPQTTDVSGSGDLSDKGREFAGRVQCLHREGRAEAFGYTFRPSQANREEFERLVCEAGQPPGSPDHR